MWPSIEALHDDAGYAIIHNTIARLQYVADPTPSTLWALFMSLAELIELGRDVAVAAALARSRGD
jgi:hypothetical protein